MVHSPRARVLPPLVLAVCALALPATASASGASPLHVDPSSPVAKAYAMPLGTARGASSGSGQAGKLFGSGIKRSDAAARTTVTLPTLTRMSSTARLRATPAAYRVLKPGSGLGLVWMAVAAMAVLSLGIAGGLALNRRR